MHRAFPLSNWTELESCCTYLEHIPIVRFYFASDALSSTARDAVMVDDRSDPLHAGEVPSGADSVSPVGLALDGGDASSATTLRILSVMLLTKPPTPVTPHDHDEGVEELKKRKDIREPSPYDHAFHD